MTLELVPWRGDNVPLLSSNGNGISRSFGINDYLSWLESSWRYGGNLYPTGTTGVTYTQNGKQAEPVSNNFEGYVRQLFYADGPVAAVEWKRVEVFAQAPMLFQKRKDGRPGDLYDDESLDLVRAPWVGGTTSDLQARSLLFADLGGNAYVVAIEDELVVLRPDYVQIVLEPRMVKGAQVGWRQVGITYQEAGTGEVAMFMRGEYAHYAPKPDPLASYRGMSWLTPVIREIQADVSAVDGRLAFQNNASTPNLAVKIPQPMTPDQFKEFVEMMDSQHRGAVNSGKTLYTAGGADVTVVGSSMREMDFTALLGKSETRVANAGGLHPAIVGFSEGMQGSSMNAGNYQAAKRQTVDTTFRHLWSNWCGSFQQLFPPPKAGDRLWYDIRDIPFLHDDARDLAAVQQTQGAIITTYVREGFTPKSAVAAVKNDDVGALEHTGLTSVQLTPPSEGELPPADTGAPTDTTTPDQPAVPVDEQGRAAVWLWSHLDVMRGGGTYHFRHGWIPVSPLAVLSPEVVDEEYGTELDHVEFGDVGRIVARQHGVTVESDSGSDIAIHATPSPDEAQRWADAIEQRESFSRHNFATEPHDGGMSVRFGDHEVELDESAAHDVAQGLRDMSYVSEDKEPADSESHLNDFAEETRSAGWLWDVDQDGYLAPDGVLTLARCLGWTDLARADVRPWATDWLQRNVDWEPDLHPRGDAGRFIRKLLGAAEPNAPQAHAAQRVVAHGGSVASIRLRPRKVRVDDRVYNPANPKQMGTVVAVFADPKIRVRYPDGREGVQTLHGHRRPGLGDYVQDPDNPKVKGRVEAAWTDRTMRVRWDDGRTEVRPLDSVTDPIPEPRHRYAATPPEPVTRLGDEMPVVKPTKRQKIADKVAAGQLPADAGRRLAAGESPVAIVDERSPEAFREAETAKLSAADRAAVEGLDPDKRELYWLRRTAGQSHDEAVKDLAVKPEPAKKAVKAATAKRAPRKKAIPAAAAPEPLSTDPAIRAVQVENRIRAAYRDAPKAPGGWVGLAQLRASLGDLNRDEVDAALAKLARQHGVRLAPNENTKSLGREDREAAVHLGDSDRHMIAFGRAPGTDASDRSLPATAPLPVADPASARTTAQLRAYAKAHNISIPSKLRTKEAIREYLLSHLGG